MEENTVVSTPTESAPAEFVAATVFEFAPETDAQPVDEAKEETEVSEAQVVEETSSEEVDTPAETKTQKDIDAAFGKEKRRIREAERAKYEEALSKDPMRNLGKLMVDDLVQSKGLSEEDAIKEATDNFLKAIAKREGITPTIARKLYGNDVKKEVEKAAETLDVETEAQRIWQEVDQAFKPEGFDVESAYKDSAFVQLLTEMPAAAAIRVYHAEKQAENAKQDIAEKLMSRQRLPQMTKPAQSATPKTDWLKADKEAFLAEKERRRRMR